MFRFYLLWGFSAADSWSRSEINSDIDMSWGSGYTIDQTSHNLFIEPWSSKIKRRDVWLCDYPYDKSCLCAFWPCHPYFILQFYLNVFYTCPFFFVNDIANASMLWTGPRSRACTWRHVTIVGARACACKYNYALAQLYICVRERIGCSCYNQHLACNCSALCFWHNYNSALIRHNT